eukprot:NODE_170_length_16226_cov_0.451169.p8 type:complete len:308 gc:universal NODE_170_length_16226_cov_0.451169:2866-1943(-)
MFSLFFQSMATSCFDTLPNKAINGKWFMTVNGSTQLCESTCQNMSNCTAVTYTSLNAQSCTLWNEISAIVDISSVTTKLRNLSDSNCTLSNNENCLECKYSKAINLGGDNSAYKLVKDENQCSELCSSLKSCQGYSIHKGPFKMGCMMYLKTLVSSVPGVFNFMRKGDCLCSSKDASTSGTAPQYPSFREISQMEILGLTLVALFGIVALGGVIYVILYSYKPMKKSIPRWHSSSNSPTTPTDGKPNAFNFPIKDDTGKHESVSELRSLNMTDVHVNGKGTFRLSLPSGYVKLSDFDGNPCAEAAQQ